MKTIYNFILIPFLLFVVIPSLAQKQDSLPANSSYSKFRHEIGLDVSNSLFLLRKMDNAYLVNYKYHIGKYAIRSGINLKMESTNTGEKSIDYRLGLEKVSSYKKWQVFGGIDLGFSYKRYNFQGNYISQYIVAPLIGFRYFISPRFSISTEPKLFCKYIQTRDPDSFNRDANSNDFLFEIGSIGVILVNFHF